MLIAGFDVIPTRGSFAARVHMLGLGEKKIEHGTTLAGRPGPQLDDALDQITGGIGRVGEFVEEDDIRPFSFWRPGFKETEEAAGIVVGWLVPYTLDEKGKPAAPAVLSIYNPLIERTIHARLFAPGNETLSRESNPRVEVAWKTRALQQAFPLGEEVSYRPRRGWYEVLSGKKHLMKEAEEAAVRELLNKWK